MGRVSHCAALTVTGGTAIGHFRSSSDPESVTVFGKRVSSCKWPGMGRAGRQDLWQARPIIGHVGK